MRLMSRNSVWLGALLYLPISAAFFFIGTGLFAFYTARPELLPGAAAASPDTVFPNFSTKSRTAKVAVAPPKQNVAPGIKEQVTLRIDQDVLEHFQAGGPGWQDRINDALRKAVGK